MWQDVIKFYALIVPMAAMATETEFHLYRPLTARAFQPQIKIITRTQGECWQQSRRIQREDAWHCMANSIEYDPCFVKPFGSKREATCIQYPWSTEGIQIQLSSPLDNSQHIPLDMSKTFPWALELSNGQACYKIDSQSMDQGMSIRYRCDEKTVLIGEIQRCNNPWQIQQHDSLGYTMVTIAKAWY